MMKKILLISMILLMVFISAGCGQDKSMDGNNLSEEKQNESTDGKISQEKNGEEYSENDIELDLTKLSSTMIYSEIYNLVADPEKHFGDIIRIVGRFDLYKDEATGENFYAVFIADAAACCQQGLEFEPKKKYKFPDDFPEVGSEVIVTGEFQSYEADGFKYCYLKNATIKGKK